MELRKTWNNHNRNRKQKTQIERRRVHLDHLLSSIMNKLFGRETRLRKQSHKNHRKLFSLLDLYLDDAKERRKLSDGNGCENMADRGGDKMFDCDGRGGGEARGVAPDCAKSPKDSPPDLKHGRRERRRQREPEFPPPGPLVLYDALCGVTHLRGRRRRRRCPSGGRLSKTWKNAEHSPLPCKKHLSDVAEFSLEIFRGRAVFPRACAKCASTFRRFRLFFGATRTRFQCGIRVRNSWRLFRAS